MEQKLAKDINFVQRLWSKPELKAFVAMDISSNEKHLQVGFVVSDSQATTTFSKLSSVKPFGLTAALSPSKLRRFKENKRFKLLVLMYFIATVTNCVSCRGQEQKL